MLAGWMDGAGAASLLAMIGRYLGRTVASRK